MARARAKQKPKKPAPAALLAAARDALRKGDLGGGLEKLVEAWRERPAAAIADVIDALGARAMIGIAQPSGKTPKERNAAWAAAARAGDAAVRGVLLASVTDTKGNAETLERLELLAAQEDPRVARVVADLLEAPIYNASVGRTRKFWKRLLELAVAIGDERMLARSARFAAAWAANRELNDAERAQLAIWLRRLTPALEAAFGDAAPLAGEDAARCAEVAAAVPSPTAHSLATRSTATELLEAIYANPDDDAARIVYGDVLAQRNDPRGELIALQFARVRGGTPTREQARREKELLAEYMMDWLGPIGPLVKKTTARFERGFLDACDLKDGKDVDASPQWATVRELRGGVPPRDRPMPALRVLHRLTGRHILKLAEHPGPLFVEDLTWFGPDFWRSDYYPEHDEEQRAAVAAFGRLALPLRVLKVQDGAAAGGEVPAMRDLAWIWEAPCTARLEHLRILTALGAASALVEALVPTTIRVLEFPRIQHEPVGWTVRFERDGGGPFARLVVASEEFPASWPTIPAFDAAMRALPAGQLAEIRIEAPPRSAEILRRSLSGQRAAVFASPTSLTSGAG